MLAVSYYTIFTFLGFSVTCSANFTLRPSFVSHSQVIKANVGDNVTLPCKAQNLGNSTLIFRHIDFNGKEKIFFVGEMKLRRDTKIIKDGADFVLPNVQKEDSGEYICRIETEPVVMISHQLQLFYPPLAKIAESEIQPVSVGSNVTLVCSADGNPAPTIQWLKQEIDSATLLKQGPTLTFRSVDRGTEGVYVCSAINPLGESTAKVMLSVEYPPEISTEEAVLHTGVGAEAILVCVVHGRPYPSVSWLKDNHPITKGRNVQITEDSHRHVLSILNVTDRDLGEYACLARSLLGQKVKTMTVTGRPKVPKLIDVQMGFENGSFIIVFETKSLSPVTNFHLKYRKQQQRKSDKANREWTEITYTTNDMDVVIIPREGGILRVLQPVWGLRANTDYEATIQVENKFGWSGVSEILKFHTGSEMSLGVSASEAAIQTHIISILLLTPAFLAV